MKAAFFNELEKAQNILVAGAGSGFVTCGLGNGRRIIATCREQPAELAAQRLIELVRCPSGRCPMMWRSS